MAMNWERLKRAAEHKKAVLLDLDNTLYAYNPCHRYALKETHRAYCRKIRRISFSLFHERYRRAQAEIHRRLRGQAASHSRLQYFQILLAGESLISSALDFERIYWNSFLGKMRLSGWVLPFLDFCKKENKNVGIVTNLTTAIQMRKLKALKLDSRVDFLVTSEEAGREKPHPKIFRLAVKKARVRPSEILMVGDSPKLDNGSSFSFFKVSGLK